MSHRVKKRRQEVKSGSKSLLCPLAFCLKGGGNIIIGASIMFFGQSMECQNIYISISANWTFACLPSQILMST